MLCLLAILLGPAQVFPGLLAVGAALEGSHTIRVGCDGSEFHLVLSHERGQAGRPDYNPRHHPQNPAHHHGLAAGFLCLIAGRGGMEPDHVADFTTGSGWENLSQPSAEAMPADTVKFMPVESESASSMIELTRFLSLQDHGPPDQTGLVLLLRSTVLLV